MLEQNSYDTEIKARVTQAFQEILEEIHTADQPYPMKLLKIAFKNINSLRGEHKIDFTKEPFLQNSLFAITGPTGSGKTTILDVISLALWNQVPRLGKMSTTEVLKKEPFLPAIRVMLLQKSPTNVKTEFSHQNGKSLPIETENCAIITWRLQMLPATRF